MFFIVCTFFKAYKIKPNRFTRALLLAACPATEASDKFEISLVRILDMSQCMRFFNNVVCATSKASDQPAHTCCLIRAFAIVA